MKRREFFRFAAATTAASSLASLPASARAQTWTTRALDRTLLPQDIPAAAPALDQAFQDLLGQLDRSGWRPFLLTVAGFDIRRAMESEDELFRELAIAEDTSVTEFAGRRAIQPGDPAMSLLYHVLAASEVRPAGVRREGYPTLEMLDTLENYIFDRFDPARASELVPAIFAYEYRQAFKTPHRLHADLAYARTGVSRTGTLPSEFDPLTREYSAATPSEDVPNPCPVSGRSGGCSLHP